MRAGGYKVTEGPFMVGLALSRNCLEAFVEALSALVPKVNSAHASILVQTINLSALRGCAIECTGIDVSAQGWLLITWTMRVH